MTVCADQHAAGPKREGDRSCPAKYIVLQNERLQTAFAPLLHRPNGTGHVLDRIEANFHLGCRRARPNEPRPPQTYASRPGLWAALGGSSTRLYVTERSKQGSYVINAIAPALDDPPANFHCAETMDRRAGRFPSTSPQISYTRFPRAPGHARCFRSSPMAKERLTTSIAYRLGWAIYWICIVFGLVWVGGIYLYLSNAVGESSAFPWTFFAVMAGSGVALSYAAGRFLRYVLSDE